MALAFIDLLAQRRRIGDKIDAAVAKVLAEGRYILGPEVAELEKRLSAYCGAAHALACANGTDALALPLMAWGARPKHAIFCPSFTFASTAEVIPWLGSQAVFVDVLPDTYCLDPAHLEASLKAVVDAGELEPLAVIAVDLFGQPADYPAIADICQRYGVKLIADSAQGFGATLNGAHPIDWADVVTTSFYPAKPLGCYGDGGAVLTNDTALHDLLDSLHVHGKVTPADLKGASFDHDPKYMSMRIGMNSRLDTIQAAVLLEKLAVFEDEIRMRNAVAERYNEKLQADVSRVPRVIEGGTSVWAQYVIEHQERDKLQAHLRENGVPTAVYYPVPMHLQPPYRRFASGPGGLPVTEAAMGTVLALPMHPDLTPEDQDIVIDAIKRF